GGARQRRDGLLARVDEVGIDAPLLGRRAHAEQAVLGVEDDLLVVREEVGHERRGADAEVDERALGDVGGDAGRELVARDAGGHRVLPSVSSGVPSIVTPPTNVPSTSPARSPPATTRSTKMPGVTTVSGTRSPTGTPS